MDDDEKLNNEINTNTKKSAPTEEQRGNTGTDEAPDEWVRYLAKALVRDWKENHMYRRLRFR